MVVTSGVAYACNHQLTKYKRWIPTPQHKSEPTMISTTPKTPFSNDSEDRLGKCDQKRISATSLFSAAFKRQGLVWTQEKFLCFLVAGFEFISVLVQLPVPKTISMISIETTSSERATIITFEGSRLFSQFLHIFHGFSTNFTQIFMNVIM